MMKDVKNSVAKSDTILQDFAGAAALVVMLVVGLHLPGLI